MVETMNRVAPYAEQAHKPPKELLNEIATRSYRPRILDRKPWPRTVLHLLEECSFNDASARPAFSAIVPRLEAIVAALAQTPK
ncbi:hypothetical protein SDRG_08029 [Saprolegnia diclina VS20]|uniref:Serine-threonine/tyrosine-protein kinase catalytic domain-containing protein n=1 Tax=Saprolegnia diclina (strain VS20) TaxID=1156394 RepID=T0RQ84_SAPDV|nr:hypothetical protein SDRG_08029 [Saprolegnia diclina VS20]EQC34713.1 hypothetical protein SDRG_08029 [Saprolegnia diclina VS20]|eukprot:XP_008612119.1 hypothetical protein SDRG_08029 [Saprolegnia diclina VS20]